MLRYAALLTVLAVLFSGMLHQAGVQDFALWGPAAAAVATLLTLVYFRIIARGPPLQASDYRRNGILRCGTCTRGGGDNEHKVVYADRSSARKAAQHYHRRFQGTLQEPYEAECGRWHLYTPR